MALVVTTVRATTKFPWWLRWLTQVLRKTVFSGCTRNLVLKAVRDSTKDVNVSLVGKKAPVTVAVQKLQITKLNTLRKPLSIM